MPTIRTLLLAFAGLVLLSPAQAATATQTPRPVILQSIDIDVPAPPAAVNVGGTRRLAYELHITNFLANDVRIDGVDVLDAANGSPLMNLDEAALQARIAHIGASGAADPGRRVGPGRRAVIHLWLPLREDTAAPPALRHRVTLSFENGQRHVVDAEPLAVDGKPPVVLHPPLRGGPWVALYDPEMKRGHRTSIYTVDGKARIPARFAIDWKRLAADGSRARGDGSRITDWHGYGEAVLAVADAVVADARDDMPEAAEISAAAGTMPLQDASGNYVVLDLGEGRYAFYEHLRHGSIRVRPGDRVAAGDMIGELGNSGSSSAGPHLHFHLADRNSLLGAEGLPYVFRGFERLGAYESIAAFARGDDWQPAGKETAVSRRDELPDANAVIVFDAND